jgi:hypothetical protein
MPGLRADVSTTALLAGLSLALGRGRTADRGALLDRLPRVEHQPEADEEQLFEQAGLARVLMLLVKVNQESEYLLCRELAEHALGAVPDPGEMPEPGDSSDLGWEYS